MLVGIVIGGGHLPFWWAPKTADPLLIFISLLARAPAGWIVGIGGAGTAAISMWTARAEILAGHRISVVLMAIALALLSGMFFLTTFF